MSIFRIKIPHGHTTFTDTNLGAVADNISSEGVRIFSIRADNTLNVSADSYVKIYTAASPIVGTTAPVIILRAAANSIMTQHFSFGSLPGLFLPNNLEHCMPLQCREL